MKPARRTLLAILLVVLFTTPQAPALWASTPAAQPEDVKNTRGVWLVRNYIKIRPGSGVLSVTPMIDQDARTARDIRKLLDMDPLVPQDHISVSVNSGVVRLGGIVTENAFEGGARQVRNRLRVVTGRCNP